MRPSEQVDDAAVKTTPATAAFMEGLERNQSALYSFARRLVGDGEEARDVVQETFADGWRLVLRERPPFSPGCEAMDVRRWLFHVAYQRAVSVRRHRAMLTFKPLGDKAVAQAGRGETALSFEERLAEGDALRAAVDRLEDGDAACILLKVVHGFTSVEIARTLDMTPAAVRQRLSRAMRRLRRYGAAATQVEDEGTW